MDAETLRARQAPLKQKYRDDPASARTTLVARGHLDVDEIRCRVETDAAPITAALHPMTGGDGLGACAGDMLLQSLAACAGVTMAAVARALQIPLHGGIITVEGDLDFRGTLGVSKEVPVGFDVIRVRFELDTAASQEQVDRLIQLTERYCVIFQTLQRPPRIEVAVEPKNLPI